MKCSSAKPLESKWDHLIKQRAGARRTHQNCLIVVVCQLRLRRIYQRERESQIFSRDSILKNKYVYFPISVQEALLTQIFLLSKLVILWRTPKENFLYPDYVYIINIPRESFLYKKRPNHLVSEKVEFQHVLCAHGRMDWLQGRQPQGSNTIRLEHEQEKD